VAIQADGKIVTVGTSVNTYGLHDIAILRQLPNGTPDNTFGSFGKVIINNIRVDQFVESVAIQPDGKIVAAGRYKSLATTPGSNVYYFMTIRLNPNGTLDNSFNGTGKVLTSFNTGNCMAHSVAIQANGKIVVGGQNYNGSYNDFAFARYNSNGTPDNTFGAAGKKIVSVSMKGDYCNEIAIQNDGKIVAAGITDKSVGYRAVAVIRLWVNGSPDPAFGINGFVITDLGADHDSGGLSVALQPDGKIVVSGHDMDDPNLQGYFLLARYNNNGTLDAAFNNGNVVLTQVQYYDRGESVAIQADGKIVVAGMVESFSGFEFNSCVLRYTPTGALDNTFGPAGAGYVVTNFGGTNLSAQDWLNGVAIQADGKIAACGTVQTQLFNPFYFLNVRYLASGAPFASIKSGEMQTAKMKKTTLSVYPNPATDFIVVHGLNTEAENKIVITNMQGNVLKQFTVNNSNSCIVHLEKLPRGTYMATINAANEKTSIKFIKN